MPVNTKLAQLCTHIFDAYLEKYDAIEMISLATSDGFPVINRTTHNLSIESDTMAAASSTLFSVSNAISKQILRKEFKVTFIESGSGNIAFIALSLQGMDYVLAMSAAESMNIGQLRVFIHRINNDIIEKVSTIATISSIPQ